MNLNVIPELIKNFPNQIIGLSDHENGAHSASIAYYLGARVFEKHFTLNRSWKGTDHSFSLEPRGLAKLTRNLSRIPGILGSSEKKLLPCEEKPLYKMRKSIVARTDLNKDTVLNYEHIDYKCPGGGLEPYRISDVIGKKLNKNLKKDNLVTFEDLYDG
jgi:N-acetylneuraminate synthase/sialic acid synthase